MGAPKQKWTSEEEAALRAGIVRYGLGKWSTILKDPEFSTVLRSRSNVDLKDKWRNLKGMGSCSGSRQKHKVSVKIKLPAAKHDEEVVHKAVEKELPGATPRAFRKIQQDTTITKKQIIRMEDVVLEAIKKLNEPQGSRRLMIAQYIEEHYPGPLELEKSLSTTLKDMTDDGLLLKSKHRYRITPKPFSFAVDNEPTLLPTIGSNKSPGEAGKNSVLILTKAQIDAELEEMKNMTAAEAAKAAAQAVAEAEALIAEAEAAEREAQEAEAEAEAARSFADATQISRRWPYIRVW